MTPRPAALAAASLLCSLAAWGADPSPELQLAMQSLRPGERDRLFKALGPLDEAPLYRADLEVDVERRTVTGKLAVTFVPRKKAAEALELRVTPNAGDKGRLKVSHASRAGRPLITEQPEPTLFRVKLDPPAEKGLAATVDLRLSGKLPEAPPGSDSMQPDPGQAAATRADHGAFMAGPEVVNLAGVIPGIPPLMADGQRMGGPSGIGDLTLFEPAHYLVTVVVPRGWTAVASGAPLGEVPEKDGRVRFSFGISGARDFALFLTRGYQVDSVAADGVAVESHFLPQDRDAGARALKYAAAALAELQKRIGPYPWTSFRVVQTRLVAGAGGMEFPGLVAVSTGLYRGAADPLSALGLPGFDEVPMFQAILGDLKPMMEQTLEFTIAHEVAHQWFPMTVGSDPIDEPVVDEALAQAAALLYLEWRHGRKKADNMRDVQLKLSYQFHRLMGGADGPALRPTRAFSTVGEYAALVYGKAPLLFDDQRKLAGDAAFFASLKTYAEAFRWHWAGPKSFTEVLARKVPKHAKPFEELRVRHWEQERGDEDVGQQGLLSQLPPGATQILQGFNPNGPSKELAEEQQRLLEEAMKILQGAE